MAETVKTERRIGVALSGGGARGFAHVGVLKALEEAGLRPSVIAGVSAGSVIAVLYAAGVSFDNMMKLFEDAKFTSYAELRMGRGGGLFRIDKFKKHIYKAIGEKYRNLEDLDIPTYLGVTDLDHGEAVDFSTGPIGDIMVASCSIPLLFQPVNIGGTRYVDGGVLCNLPASVLRDKCDYLIGVNCSPLDHDSKFKNTMVDVGLRTYALATRIHQARDMKLCDLYIAIPEIASYKAFNLKQIKEVYLRGYTTARSVLQKAGLMPGHASASHADTPAENSNHHTSHSE